MGIEGQGVGLTAGNQSFGDVRHRDSGLPWLLLLVVVVGCDSDGAGGGTAAGGSDLDAGTGAGDGGLIAIAEGGEGVAGGGPGADGGGAGSNGGGAGSNGGGMDDGGAPTGTDPFDLACANLACGPGERCVPDDVSEARCEAVSCDDLDCAVTEVCDAAPTGTGSVCRDNSCDSDLACGQTQFCNADGICEADVCEPGARVCEGAVVRECDAAGGRWQTAFECSSAGGFESACLDDGDGQASCGCQADWDCPAFTACVVDQCQGSGEAPTCLLDPAPFSEALPTPEYGTREGHWGGPSIADKLAQAGTPFPQSAQVVMTPVVANLTDDNGDGLVNELDFPEIVFLTFCNSAHTNNGMLRAIHGGGPRRGEDLFAVCGPDRVWREGDPLEGDGAMACACSGPVDLDPTAGVAIGDIDGDGLPEIVTLTENDHLRVHSNTGEVVAETAGLPGTQNNGSPAIANLDAEGLAEIVLGNVVVTLREVDDGAGGLTLAIGDVFDGNGRGAEGRHGQGPISCVADMTGDGRQEVVAGSSVYRLPAPPSEATLGRVVTSSADCNASEVTDAADKDYCDAKLTLVWSGPGENPGQGAGDEGFCAVADIWGSVPEDTSAELARPGPNSPLDGEPELVLVTGGRIQIFQGSTGRLLYNESFPGDRGGAPNVDDFDGDGFPEVGTAFKLSYQMVDLQPATDLCPAWTEVWASGGSTGGVAPPASSLPRQPPAGACSTHADCDALGEQFACNVGLGQCVCLHNGWSRQTQDDSSRVTGSSVFDFNGDGAAEVIYNDECFFRVYAGLDGEELFVEPSESRTRTENPVVADVDNDGNAEIVFATSNESGYCGGDFKQDDRYNNGLEVWGDAEDLWVSARRIYNQHAYHVTNITEGGAVPLQEPRSWQPLNGRLYNSYRSQPRSGVGILAPDLTVVEAQASSPDSVCGMLSDQLDIAVQIENQGDLRVGPGVEVGVVGVWTSDGREEPLQDGAGEDLTVELTTSLEPGGSLIVTLSYEAGNDASGELPDEIIVTVDRGDSQRECDEGNNVLRVPVVAGAAEADLALEIGAGSDDCPDKSFPITVENRGSATASGIVVDIYIGDPSAGGVVITSVVLPDPLQPGERVMLTTTIPDFPDREVEIWGVVDPNDQVPECNDGNNVARAPGRYNCEIVIQ